MTATHIHAPDLALRLAGPKRSALLVGAGFVGLLCAWSWLAPLSSATTATGIVSPDSGRKTVQHLEGGIVERIMVAEGDTVSAGQVLAVLVDSRAKATRESQSRRRLELTAQKARLVALARSEETPDFSALRPAMAEDAELASFVDNETAVFRSRRSAFTSKIGAVQNEIKALQAVVSTADAQLSALREELDLLNDELKTKQVLLEKGYTTRPVVQALDRRRTQIEAQLAQMAGQFGGQRSTIEQKKDVINGEIASFRNEIADQDAKVSTELAAVGQQLAASNDAQRRMEVRAPEAGQVVSLKIRTPGAVLAPGAAIADLVPAEGGAVLDVRVKPNDISRVMPGQTAEVVLTSYSQREVPMLKATVKTVGADAITDPATRETYFKAELRIDAANAAKLAPGVKMVSGMPVEAYISHHERTLASWLLEPVVRTFKRGGREY